MSLYLCAVIYQFRILERWPSGNIKWILVDTTASVDANGQNKSLVLERARTPRPAPAGMARDLSNQIEVDTGQARFVISKTKFNLLDSVWFSNVQQPIVAPGTSRGIELTTQGGAVLSSADDPAPQVSIEENGSLRAVVVARGVHGGASNKLLEYTARLHFYSGRSHARVVYTLRNASAARVENVGFKSLALSVKTNLAATTYAAPSLSGASDLTGALGATETIAMFHGSSRYPQVQHTNFDERPPSGISGCSVKKGPTTLAACAANGFIDLFSAQLVGADLRAISVGTRFAAGWWPQGLSLVGDGTVRAEIFPSGNDRNYYIRHSAHTTREVLFDFALAQPRPATARADAMFAFQYPLAGKATDPEWYNLSGALWEPIVSTAREAAFNRAMNTPVGSVDRTPYFEIIRKLYWGAGGGLNQYDFAKVRATSFLRDDSNRAGGFWLHAEQQFLYNADLAVVHSDGHDYRTTGRDVTQASYFDQLANAEYIPTLKIIFELEHRHAYGMRTWYYLSGDERFKEVYPDWGEFLLAREPSDDARWMRGMLWNVYNYVDLYRFTKNAEFKIAAWSTIRRMVLRSATATNGSATWGTDWNRGFYVDPEGLFPDGRSGAAFISGAMLVRAYAYLHDFGSTTDDEFDTSLDLLDGATHYATNELWYEFGTGFGDVGFPYETPIDSAPTRDPRNESNWYGGVREAWDTFYFGYLVSGDAEFLRKGRLLLKAAAEANDPSGWYHDYPFRGPLQHLIENRAWYGAWRNLPVTVQNQGGGNYLVSWTVPANASRIRLKYANKTIVPYLNFDRFTRRYAFDPAQNVPFFAATNVSNEPPPAAPGTTQSFRVTGVSGTSPIVFAARYYDGKAGPLGR